MKALFSARSPLWQMIATLILFPLLMLAAYSRQHDTKEFNERDALVLIAGAIVAVLFAAYVAMLLVYNRRNPQTKVNIFGMSPVELKNEDEGMRMVTARATEHVYKYHTFAIPLIALVLVYMPQSVYATLSGLMILLLGHYAVYWRAIWPAFQEPTDETE